MKKAPVTSLRLAKSIAKLAADKKAIDIVLLDMRKIANFCDFFVLCTGNTERQVRAIADNINDGLSEGAGKRTYRKGLKDGRWIVLDFGNVVTHVFDSEIREFYGLEYLWQEAKKVDWEG